VDTFVALGDALLFVDEVLVLTVDVVVFVELVVTFTVVEVEEEAEHVPPTGLQPVPQ